MIIIKIIYLCSHGDCLGIEDLQGNVNAADFVMFIVKEKR